MQYVFRARPGIMLLLAILHLIAGVATFADAETRNFNVTYFYVPKVLAPGEKFVMLDCRYEGNFTILSFFKGLKEFFRYKAGPNPSVRSFPFNGVGTLEMVFCGPNACQLKLGDLTQEATGLYRCDIERDFPPYKFATMTGHMEVFGHEPRRPLLEGFADEYKEGDMMNAYCRADSGSEIRWYINGYELEELRGSVNLKKRSSRTLFLGTPPMVVVQCAAVGRDGKLYGSGERKAMWITEDQLRKKWEKHMTNKSIVITGHVGLLSVLCFLDKVFSV